MYIVKYVNENNEDTNIRFRKKAEALCFASNLYEYKIYTFHKKQLVLVHDIPKDYEDDEDVEPGVYDYDNNEENEDDDEPGIYDNFYDTFEEIEEFYE